MDTLESLNRKIQGASDIKSVVKTMKSLAASNIGQYETAVVSLQDYYQTIALGIVAYFRDQQMDKISLTEQPKNNGENTICALVFGSDQGLVGSFNDSLADFVTQTLKTLPGKKEIWTVGERVQLLLADAGMDMTQHFQVPGSVTAITPLVGQILVSSQESLERGTLSEFYIFYNQSKSVTGYVPVFQRILPLDKAWRQELTDMHWPTKILPQIVGNSKTTLLALIREFLFVSIFRACAESLASENASRLAAMQRAEKNIEELLDELAHKYHRTRQSSIDEELFDVLSGFEALTEDSVKK